MNSLEATNNWTHLSFGELFDIKKGSGLSKDKLSADGKYSCILYGELYTRYNEVIDQVINRTNTNEGIPSEKGDLLIPASTTTTGIDLAIASSLKKEGILLGGDINILRRKPSAPKYNSDYLAYYLTNIKRYEIAKVAQGTTIVHLYAKDLKDIRIALPPIDIQDRIVNIIESTNQAIKNSQNNINLAEILKKSLMQVLFTRGIGHTEFRQTEIGEIPEDWEVKLLDDVAKRGTGHTPNKKNPNYYHGGVKWVSLTDSSKLDKGVISVTCKEISNEGINNSSAVLHNAGTVILSRDAGVGKSAILGCEMAVSQHFVTWRCEECLNNWFLYYYLQYKKTVFENIAIGSTIKTIGMPYFKQMKMIVPPIHEQEKIADILQLIDNQIEVNEKLKAKQEQLKRGLMQDLLTGKVEL